MKIQTLLRAYDYCNDGYRYYLYGVPNYKRMLRRKRQSEAIRKGIISKFERLERENFKLRIALYAKDNPTPYECRYDPEDFGWSKMSPFVCIKTDK